MSGIIEFIKKKLIERNGLPTDMKILCHHYHIASGKKVSSSSMRMECNNLVDRGIIRASVGGDKQCKFYIATQAQIQAEHEYAEKCELNKNKMRTFYVPDALMRHALERTADARKIPSKM